MFFNKTQLHSSLLISDINGVEILLQIPSRIYSLFMINVNFKITLIEETITAEFI